MRNRICLRKSFWQLGCLAALFLSACSAVVPETNPAVQPEPVLSMEPAAAARSSTPAAVLTPSRTVRPSPSPMHTLPPSSTPTLDPAALETQAAAQNATDFAYFQATATAVLQALQETAQPRTFQSMQSPDGAHLAEITILDCVQVLPPSEMANSYEVLTIDGQFVEDQFLYCGGLGAAGLGGLFWSENSRFFYYTDAREGVPDGGGPWIRPISRYDTGTGEHEMLWMPVFSADGRRVAGGQGASLVVWDFEAGDLARFDFAGSERSWVNAAAWSPDERSIAFAVQDCPAGGCDAILVSADLETMQMTELARLPNTQVNEMTWPEPDTILYFDYNIFNSVVFKPGSGALATVTPRPTSAVSPAPFIFPTFTPYPTYAPEAAFPLERYPFESPFLQPVGVSGTIVTGHGCPSLIGVENVTAESATAPTAKDLDLVLGEVLSGDVIRLRKASDRAYWPISGLNVRKERFFVPADTAVVLASESPHTDLLTRACGPDVVARSWWVRIEPDSQVNHDYFFIRRQGQWLVWLSITTFEQ